MTVRRAKIRDLVAQLLDGAHVKTPPVPVLEISSQCGVAIQSKPFSTDLSGFLFRKQDVALIGVNSRHAEVRRRFTIAHELGHFLLHGETSVEMHVDRAYVKARNKTSSEGTDPDEVEANYFAAELLMPRRFLEEDIAAIKDFDLFEDADDLAKKYMVSTQALLIRLDTLGYEFSL